MPEKVKRKKFKRDNEYRIILTYLFAPLFIFIIELLYLNAGYTFREIKKLPLIILTILQVILFLKGVIQVYRFFKLLKKQNEVWFGILHVYSFMYDQFYFLEYLCHFLNHHL